jgi:CRISPR-associated protein Cmr1
MKTFNVVCKVITPLFMGGADQQAELRTQSINGLLRWWFRVAGGSIEDEKRIFGWAGETSNHGLVRIFIKDFDKLQKDKFSKEFDDKGRVRQDKGINYIGFSLDQRFNEKQDRPRREYIKENQTFEIKISFHPRANEEDIKKFFCALWLAFNLGNFGSRSRRGFGSIKIEGIEENGNDITNNFYGLNFVPSGNLSIWISQNLSEIQKIIGINPRNQIPYLFDNFEIYIFGSNNDWQNLLNQAGQKYQSFRKQKPIDDRIVFGLPIVAVGKYRNLRRASPLMFKILEVDKNKYVLLLIVMKPDDKRPFKFHPEIKSVNWNLLSGFVSRFEKIYPP